LPADAPKLQSIAAGVAAAVLLSVAPANAGVILEQPQIKKVRHDAAQLLYVLHISHGQGRLISAGRFLERIDNCSQKSSHTAWFGASIILLLQKRVAGAAGVGKVHVLNCSISSMKRLSWPD
jgi:hypothetical protein